MNLPTFNVLVTFLAFVNINTLNRNLLTQLFVISIIKLHVGHILQLSTLSVTFLYPLLSYPCVPSLKCLLLRPQWSTFRSKPSSVSSSVMSCTCTAC